MKKRYFTLIALTALSLSSCKDNEIFEKEMYKNVVALISSDYHNTFQTVVPMTGEEITAYIAASSGGTHATTSDLVIGLEEDQTPLDTYNWALYDADRSLYAKLLPKDKYSIEDYKITIEAGERTGRAKIRIRPEGLSPDSTYFIGLKATETNGVEINEKKRTMLYQVLIKNNYASQAENTFYSMNGTVNGIVTAASKKLFPLSHNSVRVVAGNETFQSRVDHINNNSIILEVVDGNKVNIKSYKNLSVDQLNNDPRYPNEFRLETSFGRTYNVFSLSYQYTIGSTTKVMKEELRIEVKP